MDIILSTPGSMSVPGWTLIPGLKNIPQLVDNRRRSISYFVQCRNPDPSVRKILSDDFRRDCIPFDILRAYSYSTRLPEEEYILERTELLQHPLEKRTIAKHIRRSVHLVSILTDLANQYHNQYLDEQKKATTSVPKAPVAEDPSRRIPYYGCHPRRGPLPQIGQPPDGPTRFLFPLYYGAPPVPPYSGYPLYPASPAPANPAYQVPSPPPQSEYGWAPEGPAFDRPVSSQPTSTANHTTANSNENDQTPLSATPESSTNPTTPQLPSLKPDDDAEIIDWDLCA
ncbi:MAG: hypothetical protein Q9223_004936 [Gallowayella weberi]